jgi:hypothetical protein
MQMVNMWQFFNLRRCQKATNLAKTKQL